MSDIKALVELRTKGLEAEAIRKLADDMDRELEGKSMITRLSGAAIVAELLSCADRKELEGERPSS